MLTDQQREQLATLAPGERTVLVDEYDGPTLEITREGYFAVDAAQSLTMLDHAPHGKPGDEFTEGPFWNEKQCRFDPPRTFRTKSVEVEAREPFEQGEYWLAGVHPIKGTFQCWPTEELAQTAATERPYYEWLTEVERQQ